MQQHYCGTVSLRRNIYGGIKVFRMETCKKHKRTWFAFTEANQRQLLDQGFKVSLVSTQHTFLVKDDPECYCTLIACVSFDKNIPTVLKILEN